MDFFAKLEALHRETSRLYNINIGCENSEYCTHADRMKNSYLVFACFDCEDCLYGGIALHSRDCVDCEYIDRSELCYECVDADQSYNCDFCQDIKNCSDCVMCFDCIGCKNCFGCVGLRQKEYCIFNEQLTKEKYAEQVAELRRNLKTPEGAARVSSQFGELKLKIQRRGAYIIQSENCSGDHILQSKNCLNCFDAHDCEDSLYLYDCWQTKDSAELGFSAETELSYESFSIGTGSYNTNFSNYTRACADIEYCELCFNCKNCFGCIGLKGKQYHILNKPYPRDEYFKRVAEIKAQLRAENSYGRWQFPSTYKFEDTAAAQIR